MIHINWLCINKRYIDRYRACPSNSLDYWTSSSFKFWRAGWNSSFVLSVSLVVMTHAVIGWLSIALRMVFCKYHIRTAFKVIIIRLSFWVRNFLAPGAKMQTNQNYRNGLLKIQPSSRFRGTWDLFEGGDSALSIAQILLECNHHETTIGKNARDGH